MKATWCLEEGESVASYREFHLVVRDVAGFPATIYGIDTEEGFRTMKEAQGWAVSATDLHVELETLAQKYKRVFERAERLREIRYEIGQLLNEAIDLVGQHSQDRARSHWYAHMRVGLGGGPGFTTSIPCSMQDTIDGMVVQEEAT